jgi:hypothetical protein
METSLHRSLKQLYTSHGARTEAAVRGYRADVLSDGLVVEIQASPLGAISRKVADLLKHTRVLVVKPIAERKVIVWRDNSTDKEVSRRMSPKKGKLLDVFDDLVRFTRVFPHPELTIEAVLIDEEEVRVPRRRRRFRRPDYRVQDRRLLSIVSTHRLRTAADLVALLPSDLPSQFTSDVLAARLGQVPLWFARRVAYTLRHCGSARMTGKVGNRLVYELEPTHQPESEMMVAC